MIAYWEGKSVGTNKRKQISYKTKAVYTPKEYKLFIKDLSYAIMAKKETYQGYVDVTLIFELWKRKDSDSIIKPILDAIEAAGIIPNDNMVRNIYVYRAYHRRSEPDKIYIKIEDSDRNPTFEELTQELIST